MNVQDIHVQSLATSAELSSYSVANSIPPLDVISVLNDAGISFVLVGAYGLSGWMDEPRATQDVDFIVALRQIRKAVNALLAAFDNLQAEDLPVVVGLVDRQTQRLPSI